MSRRIRLGESLVESGLINAAQLDEALARKTTTGERIGESLVALGYITERDLVRTLAKDADIPFLESSELRIDPAVVPLISAQAARANNLVPLRADGRALVVAMSNPFDIGVIRSLERASGRQIRTVTGDPVIIAQLVESHYGGNGGRTSAQDQAAVGSARPNWAGRAAGVGTATATQAPPLTASPATAYGALPPQAARQLVGIEDGQTAAELADGIIKRGVQLSATDIHIEPLEESVQVRYRVDGVLQDGAAYPKALQAALMSRIKILSGLDIAESRLPQDGRAKIRLEARAIDLRVSTFPTVHGEDVVLRILDRGRVALKLDTLGIEPEDVELIRAALRKPFGLMPVTGPTGSGKTTTLYSALLEITTVDRCIITLEDPVEYEVEHIRQSQINVRAGLTFASGLRSILRHDPDVILVGEMRDSETVHIALSAALTGHLVLTTLHTTTAAGAIPRLLDMGAEPFIVASAIGLIASQRLVRSLCHECRAPLTLPRAAAERFGLVGAQVFGPRGCGSCRQTGYRGRIGIFEFLPITEAIVECIYERKSSDDIRRVAARPTLLDDGLRKVRAGITSLDEVLRVVA
ncbi:MAG TPA: GspE/PulE family protein [Gemmatimonadaceae bacterium]|nr:GspE/PulE family protein [Gemmatimonadaceae bacterium]